jgi:predicted RNA-binding Zn ribbon-like protein
VVADRPLGEFSIGELLERIADRTLAVSRCKSAIRDSKASLHTAATQLREATDEHHRRMGIKPITVSTPKA